MPSLQIFLIMHCMQHFFNNVSIYGFTFLIDWATLVRSFRTFMIACSTVIVSYWGKPHTGKTMKNNDKAELACDFHTQIINSEKLWICTKSKSLPAKTVQSWNFSMNRIKSKFYTAIIPTVQCMFIQQSAVL